MNETNAVLIIGLIAGACTTSSFIPQVYLIWKRRTADDISGVMYGIYSAGAFFWFVYGLEVHSIPVIAGNSVALILSLFVLYLKWSFNQSQKATPKDTRGLCSNV